MRALVTGASGFIGWHVVEVLLSRGWSVRVLVRSHDARQRLAGWPVEVVFGDLQDGTGLDTAIRGVNAVFHVAALYSLARRDIREMYRVNVEGTQRLLEALKRHPVDRLVYTSSTAAVGLRADGQPADESLEVDPQSVPEGYKRTKILAERLVRQAAQQGLDAVIVNPSSPIGPRDVKPTPTGRLIRDAVLGQMPAYLDTGLNWISVRDVAEGHLLALERGQPGQRYILGHVNLTLHELLLAIERQCGVPAPRLKIAWPIALGFACLDELVWCRLTGAPPKAPIAGVALARHPMYFNPARAVRELGLRLTPLEEPLREAIQWFRDNPSPKKMTTDKKGRRSE